MEIRKVNSFLNKIGKINAFTLGELLVVMVISSIVVTIAFVALSNVQKQVGSVNKTFTLQQEILNLERILVQDLQSYESSFDQKNNTVVFSKKNDTVSYKFNTGEIIRQQDTLEIASSELTLYLEGEVISKGNFDAVELSFQNTYNQQGFFISKKKDAAYYMNQ